jgi:hypothetical protein
MLGGNEKGDREIVPAAFSRLASNQVIRSPPQERIKEPRKGIYMNDSRIAAGSNRDQVAEICTRLRAEVIAHQWHGPGWRTDWAIMLTALDIAQYTGSLIVYLDVRTMAFASGVTAPTAGKSLRRLRDSNRLWLDMTHSHEKETHHVNRTTGEVFAKTHRVWTELPGMAYTYQVNPEFPRYVCKFFRSPDGGLAGQQGNAGSGAPLLRTLMRSGKTYTRGAERSRLLLGRTEAGVRLGPARVAVVQVLTAEPQMVKDIAAAARVPASSAGKILHDLESENLSHIAGNGWVRGMSLTQYAMLKRLFSEPGKGKVAKRVDRWQEERELYHDGLRRDYDEFWLWQEMTDHYDLAFA